MRRGFTLTEALMAILILGVGLLSLMALYPLAVLHINEALRNNRVAQAVQNARALLEIYHSQLPLLPSAGSFNWWYASGKAPAAIPGVPSTLLSFPTELDVEGPYQKVNQGTSPTGAPIIYPSPVFTGLRNNPADPVRYTWAYLVRGVDDSQADVTVVVFEDYDPGDPTHSPSRPPSPPGVILTQGDVSAPGAQPAGAWILDAQNGYIYRVAAKGFLELPAKANSSNVYSMPRVVEAIGLGVIRLKP